MILMKITKKRHFMLSKCWASVAHNQFTINYNSNGVCVWSAYNSDSSRISHSERYLIFIAFIICIYTIELVGCEQTRHTFCVMCAYFQFSLIFDHYRFSRIWFGKCISYNVREWIPDQGIGSKGEAWIKKNHFHCVVELLNVDLQWFLRRLHWNLYLLLGKWYNISWLQYFVPWMKSDLPIFHHCLRESVEMFPKTTSSESELYTLCRYLFPSEYSDIMEIEKPIFAVLKIMLEIFNTVKMDIAPTSTMYNTVFPLMVGKSYTLETQV